MRASEADGAARGRRAPRRLGCEIPRESELRPRVEETLPSGAQGLDRDRWRAGFMPWLTLVGLLASSLSASEIARTFRIHVGGESLRVTVPKTFEPLLPGSVYPNRRKPAAARRLPVAILDQEALAARDFLLERKILVVQRRSAPVAGILAALASQPEADPGLAVVIGFRKVPPEASGARGVAIFEPDLTSKKEGPTTTAAVALFFRMPGRIPSPDLTAIFEKRFGPNVVEKWYRGDVGFPEQAFRDVAEWSAAAVAR